MTTGRFHHGFILSFRVARNPWAKFIKYLLTSQILNLFLLTAFALPPGAIGEKLECVAICLLAFINLLDASRGEIPEIQYVTTMDRFLIVYTAGTVCPVAYLAGFLIDHFFTHEDTDDDSDHDLLAEIGQKG